MAAFANNDRSVMIYIAGLSAVALMCVTAALLIDGAGVSWSAAVIAGFLALGAWVPLRFQHRHSVQAFAVDEAVLIGLLVVAEPGVIPALMVVAVTVGHLLHGLHPRKVAFNAASVGIASTVAVSWFGAFQVRGTELLDLPSVALLVSTAVVYNVVGLLLLTALFHLLSGSPPLNVLRTSWVSNAWTLAANVVLGLALALVATLEPRGVFLIGVLGAGLHLGARSHASALGERRRMENLAALTRTLSEYATEPRALDRFLEQLGRSHGAAGSALTLNVDGEPETHVWGDATGMEVALTLADDQGEPVRITKDAHGIDALASPIMHGGKALGAVAVAHRVGLEPWGDDSLTVLAAVAGEVAVSVRSLELFEQVTRERARWAEESAKLQDILGAASDGIAMFSAAGGVVEWNPGMSTLTGVDAKQAVGHDWWTVLRVRSVDGDDLLPEGEHVVTSALAGERHGDPVAVQVLRRDGQWRWVRATFSPLVSDDGDVDGTVMVARDVTAEREVEELKADFVATVSHELRTPLTPLKGFLATVRQRSDMLSPDQLAMLHGSMESQVLRLERLVNDLLVVADLDRGRVRFGRELVSVREAAEVATTEEQATGEDRVRIVGDADLAAVADGNAVVRVLRALVSNALKHTDGPVVIELDRDGHEVVVRVGDEGPGIPPWEQEPIFKRFHRLGDHLHRTQGPGLGLSIARALVDHLGGTIEVDSDVGRGATFTLRLRSAGPVPIASSPSAEVG